MVELDEISKRAIKNMRRDIAEDVKRDVEMFRKLKMTDDDPDKMLAESWMYYAVFWIVILILAFLSGCAETTGADQCMRREIFFQCLKALPTGPVETKYNDWDEVVSQCATVAYYQSLRNKSQITAQCGV